VSDDSSDSDSDSPPPTTRAGTSRTRTPGTASRTRGVARGVHASANNASSSRPSGGNDDDAISDEDDIYAASPRNTQKSRSSGTNIATQSQTSFASSLPASQLPSQSQSQDPEEDELASGAAGLSIEPAITPGRLTVFRTAVGQLLNTPVFEDDSANVDELIAAVNRSVGGSAGGAFDRAEGVAALKKMEEANNIM
jgi:DNA replication licensing factor MCM3